MKKAVYSSEALEIRREYFREYRKNHPEVSKLSNHKYWEKRAAAAKAKKAAEVTKEGE